MGREEKGFFKDAGNRLGLSVKYALKKFESSFDIALLVTSDIC